MTQSAIQISGKISMEISSYGASATFVIIGVDALFEEMHKLS